MIARMLAGLAVTTAVLVAMGCGGETSETPPKPTGDKRPRVEGQWRFVYVPISGDGEENRRTFEFTPTCPYGACNARGAALAGSRWGALKKGDTVKLKFDSAIGDYSMTRRYLAPCRNKATLEVTQKDAYEGRWADSLQVVNSVVSNGTDYATEMTGTEKDSYSLTPAGKAYGRCGEDGSTEYSITAVRIDKPTGKPGSAAPKSTDTTVTGE